MRSDARSRTGVGLAEALAPAVAAADQPGEETLLYLLAAVLEQPLHEVADARPRGRGGGDEFLVEDHVVHAGQSLATDRVRPRQAEKAGVVQRLVPGGLPGPIFVGRRRRRESGVVVARASHAGGYGTRLLRVNQRSPSSPPMPRAASTRSRFGPMPPSTSVENNARRRKTCARHSHVLPMPPCTWIAVSHTERAERAQNALAAEQAAERVSRATRPPPRLRAVRCCATLPWRRGRRQASAARPGRTRWPRRTACAPWRTRWRG